MITLDKAEVYKKGYIVHGIKHRTSLFNTASDSKGNQTWS